MARRGYLGKAVLATMTLGLLAWVVAPVVAQEGQGVPPPPPDRMRPAPPPQQPSDREPPVRQGQYERGEYRGQAGERGINESDNAINFVRASKLMNARVVNPSGTKLGSVDNLAINAEHGQIAYVVVGTGGIAKMGEKKFAVPWPAIGIRTDDRVVLDTDKQTLKNMNGFKGKDWPATADARWLQHGGERGGEYAVAGAEERGLVAYDFRGSDLLGKKVRNEQGETLGTLHDLVINPRTGQIIYGVVSHGSRLGLGGELTAVPWSAFDTREKANLRLNIDKQRFDTAPTFSKDNWAVLSDPDFMNRTSGFYGVRAGATNAQEMNEPGMAPPTRRPMPAERRPAPEREPIQR